MAQIGEIMLMVIIVCAIFTNTPFLSIECYQDQEGMRKMAALVSQAQKDILERLEDTSTNQTTQRATIESLASLMHKVEHRIDSGFKEIRVDLASLRSELSGGVGKVMEEIRTGRMSAVEGLADLKQTTALVLSQLQKEMREQHGLSEGRMSMSHPRLCGEPGWQNGSRPGACAGQGAAAAGIS